MSRPAEDPVLYSARREAWFALVLWCAAAAWTIGYCAAAGYGRSADSLRFVCGFPDWVFWGIVVPWAVCLAVGLWFPFGFMTDEDLGAEEPESALRESGARGVLQNGWGNQRSGVSAGSETGAEREVAEPAPREIGTEDQRDA